jgi:hypothetical protein
VREFEVITDPAKSRHLGFRRESTGNQIGECVDGLSFVSAARCLAPAKSARSLGRDGSSSLRLQFRGGQGIRRFSSVKARLIIIVLAGTAGSLACAEDLRGPETFASITNQSERSRALFVEAGRVLQHPRCLNCHPVGERPMQGNDGHPHSPPVVRGPDDKGAIGLRCTTCHQYANYEPSRVPGHPLWHVAPKSMAWQTKSLGQICEQIKDPRRNGGKTLAAIHEHMAHDSLVGWGWMPGGNREPAPGTQAQLGALIAAWIESGAACPAS